MSLTLKAKKLAILLREAIVNNDINASSPMSIIAKGMELMNTLPDLKDVEDKKSLLVTVIKEIAVGSDGIAGTDDDIIPEFCVNALSTLLEQDLIGDVQDMLSDVLSGKLLNISSIEEVNKKFKACCFPQKK